MGEERVKKIELISEVIHNYTILCRDVFQEMGNNPNGNIKEISGMMFEVSDIMDDFPMYVLKDDVKSKPIIVNMESELRTVLTSANVKHSMMLVRLYKSVKSLDDFLSSEFLKERSITGCD